MILTVTTAATATTTTTTTATTTTNNMIRCYKIILTPCEDPKKGFVVTSNEPDLNGLVTQGKDESDAFMMAYEAAEMLLEDRESNTNFFLYTGHNDEEEEEEEDRK